MVWFVLHILNTQISSSVVSQLLFHWLLFQNNLKMFFSKVWHVTFKQLNFRHSLDICKLASIHIEVIVLELMRRRIFDIFVL